MKPLNLNLTNFAKVPKIPNSSKPANGKDGSLSRMLRCTHLPQSIIEGWGKEACGLLGGEVPPLPLIALSDNKYVDAVKLWVDHLSPGLTRFLQDVADTNEAYGDPFATKSPVYSNIEGGYGVFGMYNSWVGVIHLE